MGGGTAWGPDNIYRQWDLFSCMANYHRFGSSGVDVLGQSQTRVKEQGVWIGWGGGGGRGGVCLLHVREVGCYHKHKASEFPASDMS